MSKNNQPPKLAALSGQPTKLELFRVVSDSAYTNSFAFYESIPRFIVARGRAGIIKRNEDGTAAPIRRHFVSDKKAYRMLLEPAYIEQKDGSHKASFPGAKEELIEFIIYKLAVESGYFYNGSGDNKKTDNFVLLTSLYKIHDEL
jgi:hypothetical protein